MGNEQTEVIDTFIKFGEPKPCLMNYAKILLFYCLVFFTQNSAAQTTQSGNLVNHIGEIIDNLPSDSGDDYAPPSNTQLTNWESCLLNLLKKDYSASELIASQLAYDLIQFTDTDNGKTYYILQAQTLSSNYWGTYVFNPAACQSNLIIQAPHPRNDTNTGDQGIYILKEIGAFFFMVAGTHRCNSGNYSSCSGTTSTCDNSSESYRESDMAHIDNSIFHKTTEILFNKVADPYFIQLHGFSKNTSDPYLILSNGTTQTPPIDYLSKMGNALVSIDPTLTFEVAHINTSIRLKGTTNTQGRLINGSGNPCMSSSPANSGRFLHIEQERTKLRANATGWQKMADALAITFRNLNLGSSILNLNDHAALDTLSAAVTIENGSMANFNSGKLIQLNDGFHSQTGSSLIAKINGCTTISPLQIPYTELEKDGKNRALEVMKVAPNPFRESVTINYTLTESQPISLTIYDLNGRMIQPLITNKLQNRGYHEFSFFKNELTAGIYLLELKTNRQIFTQKIMLMQ